MPSLGYCYQVPKGWTVHRTIGVVDWKVQIEPLAFLTFATEAMRRAHLDVEIRLALVQYRCGSFGQDAQELN